MRVILHLSRYYDWEPVPPDVKLTPADIAGPLVVLGHDPGTFRMRVEKPGPTHRTVTIGEQTIIGMILYEKLDVRRGGATLSRKQAIAHVIQLALEDDKRCHAQWQWITKIEMEDDGPNPQLLDTMLKPHLSAIHGRRGTVHLTPDEHAAHTAAYNEPVDTAAHLAHLHAHFGVKRP